MRVALVHPVFWPEVRRGSERVVHEVGAGLAARGHEVTLITTHPGRRSETAEDGIRVIRGRRPPPVPGLGLYELYLETAPLAVSELLQGGYDVAHAFHLSSALAAVAARRLGGPPVIYSFHGIPTRRFLVARRRRIWMLRRAIAGSESTTVLSEAAARPFRRYLQHHPEVLPAGVNTGRFRPGPARDPRPTVFCASAVSDPRKRVGTLLEAFTELRASIPDAQLLLSEEAGAPGRPELPEGAEWIPVDGAPDLAAAYARAWVTALPSTEEAQGLVLLESLACGTPCVAADSGAPPEILGDSGETGLLFKPHEPAGLARALRGALDLAAAPQTAAACRSRAEDFSWERLLPEHEAVYERAVAGGRCES